MEDCRSELSNSSYSVESSFTIDRCCGRSVDPCSRDRGEKMDDLSGWTNEKHNLYLDHLERSFVKKLRHCHTWQSDGKIWGPFLIHERRTDSCVSDLRQNVETIETHMDLEAKCHVQENPWISRLRSSRDNQPSASAHRQKAVGRDAVEIGECTSLSAEIVGIEASDQNFPDIDEDVKASINHHSGKRPRSAGTAEATSIDQLCKTEKRDACRCVGDKHELLSEFPERLAYTKPDLHYFLKES